MLIKKILIVILLTTAICALPLLELATSYDGKIKYVINNPGDGIDKNIVKYFQGLLRRSTK